MSDRKYSQRGYQDSDRDRGGQRPAGGPDRPRPPREPGRPAGNKTDREPRTMNMPGFEQAIKCARCGTEIAGYTAPGATCTKCGTALRSCIQCSFFDPGSRFECMQAVAVRVSPKDAPNQCPLFEPRVQVQRQTGSTREAGPTSAKDAFDKLFNF